jgi:hypothetical protein
MDVVKKSELMAAVAQGRLHEAFEHSELGWFDVTAMRDWAKRHAEVIDVDINCAVDFIRESRVVEMTRVHELPTESWQNDPAMYVCIVGTPPEPTTYLLIDGSHRIMRRHIEGLSTFKAYIVEQKDVIRVDSTKFGRTTDIFGIDWGDPVVNGKIVRRG